MDQSALDPIPRRMCGVELIGHGGLEMLQHRTDLPVPTPEHGEVLIRVTAAGVNNTDLNLRTAWYSKGDSADDAGWGGAPVQFPLIQGADVCGRIVAVGPRVPETRVGERVIVEPTLWEHAGKTLDQSMYLGSDCHGGFAEYVAVPSRHAFAVRTDLRDDELAVIPCSSSTAENLLTRSGLVAGERVLVTGASGGVGSAAVQLARARGATVIAVAGAAKAEAVTALGASQVIPRGTSLVEALGPSSVDVVVDLVGGAQFPELLELLRPTGRYAVSGAIGGAMVELDLRTLYLKDLSMFGGTIIDPQVFPALVKRIEAGELRPPVAKTYPLEEIATAQEEFAAKRHVGKLALIP